VYNKFFKKMKKLFLFFIAGALVTSVIAQKPAVKQVPVKVNQRVLKVSMQEQQGHESYKPLKPGSKSVAPVFVGTSANAFSVVYPEANPLSYNEDFNIIGFAHRGGPSNGTSPQVFLNLSTDNGATWDTTNLVFNNASYKGRFPNSAFYNPTGNSNINNLYQLAAGMVLDANGDDYGTFVCWQKHGSAAKSYVYPYNNAKRYDFNNFQVCKDGRFHISGEAHEDDGTYLINHPHFSLLSGTLDVANDTVNSFVSHIIDAPVISYDDAGTTRYYNLWHSSGVAFNKSGTVGYFMTIGVRSDVPVGQDTNTSYRPIVYKTTDQGLTWNIQPDFNFGQIQNIKDILPGIARDTTIINPFFRDVTDLLVDANDNLHILSYIDGGSTSTTDSIGYTWGWSTIEGIMWDTYMTSTGWDATPIAVQNTQNPADVTDIFTNECRLQGAISADGKKVFYSWADSDPDVGTTNDLPDVYVASRHIDTTYSVTNKIVTTVGTTLENTATMHVMAPQVKDNGSDFTIHTIITQQGALNTDPVKYWYLKDVTMTLEVSVKDIDKNISNVSNIYPNPTTGISNIDLTLVKNANVSIQVVNMLGQVVSSEDLGYKTAGMHKLGVNASNLTGGIYFVTVKAGNSTCTSKMIVQ
jgi:hypothetical protein